MKAAHAATSRTLAATAELVADGDTLIAITDNRTKPRICPLGSDAERGF